MAKIKNQIIKNLVENGLEQTTDHTLDYKHAYKVYNFRHEVLKASKTIDEKRQELVKAAGIEDAQKFDERRKELNAKKELTKAEQKELDEMNEKMVKFSDLYSELLKDESDLNVKTIPFEEYHKLANENKQTAVQIPGRDGKPQTIFVDFFMAFRDILKDILWAAPEDDEMK